MDPDVVVQTSQLCKTYRVWKRPSSRLLAPLLTAAATVFPNDYSISRVMAKRAEKHYYDFPALVDVSLFLSRGHALGIVGRNGSGKSTLLQLLAGTLQPTSGSIVIKGRVAALLELGSGFSPEFTGRENVLLNGAILGIPERTMRQRFDEIVAFADIGDFLDQPVRTYSSGMQMRLAFAIQTAVDPTVLIVDEALAVGDAPFQAKCFARIRSLLDAGVSVIFVSHDIGTVRNLCQDAICLSHGKVYSAGSAKTVCDDYELLCMLETGLIEHAPRVQRATGASVSAAAPVAWTEDDLGAENREFARRAAQQRAGNGDVQFVDCRITDNSGRPLLVVPPDDDVWISWLLKARRDFAGILVLALTAKSLKGHELMSGTDKSQDHVLTLERGQCAVVRMRYRFPLKSDRYYLSTSLFHFPIGGKYEHGTISFERAVLLDLVEYATYFEVNWNRSWCHYGPVQIDSPQEIRVLPVVAERTP